MLSDKIFEKLSSHLKQSLFKALQLTEEMGQATTEPLHLLIGLSQQKGSMSAELLTGLQIKTEKLKDFLATSFNSEISDQEKNTKVTFSENAWEIILKALKISYLNNHLYVGTEHLLSAILEYKDSKIEEFLIKQGIDSHILRNKSNQLIESTGKLNEIIGDFKTTKITSEKNQKEPESTLDYFGRNLTNEETQKNIDPVIGRNQEIDRIIQIICRRQKNNPLLLGDPGVGKTAIIEGLAKKILAGQVPPVLLNKKIYSLDLTSLVAGTSFRGEFEARIKDVINEATNRGDVILFIDEIHQIIGAGSSIGNNMDAGNILKPALARGELKIIGATTFTDFKKTIEKDTALARRFQTVKIAEPTTEETINIINANKTYFESFHKTKITTEAVETAVVLSQKFITDKFLPDKAIDLIDESCAKNTAHKKPSPIKKQLQKINEEIKNLEEKLREQIKLENFETATLIKKEADVIVSKIKKIEKKIITAENKITKNITTKDIALTLSKTTGIPIHDLLHQGNAKNFQAKIKKQIIGQEKALKTIENIINRIKVGLIDDNRPLASLLLIGPSGVGKTLTAKVIAKEFFGSEKALVKLDMSEYGEKFNASKLIGAPAGYVGYQEGGQLTEQIKRQPYSLVLFDEIEKADPEIFNLLLQILEDGEITDASGQKINFRQTIIIMTSNLGSHHYQKQKNIGFGSENKVSNIENAVLKEVKKKFKPEFINRIDKIITYQPLNPKALTQIATIELNRLKEKINQKTKLNIVWDKSLNQVLIKRSENIDDDSEKGARAIKLLIKNELEPILAENIIKNRTHQKTLRIKSKNGIITLT